MNEILRKFTMGKPKQVIGPALWIFFENFFMSIPAILVYFVIALLIGAFSGIDARSLDLLWLLAAIMGVLFLMQVIISIFAFRNTFLPGARNSAQNKKEFLRKLRTLPLGFFMSKKSGELINTFVGDFLALEQSMVAVFVGLFSVVFGTALSVVGLFIFNPPMALALYITLPIALLIALFSARLTKTLTTKMIETKDHAANCLNEYLFGMKTLRAFNQTGTGFTKLKDAYTALMHASLKIEAVSGSLFNFAVSLVQAGIPLMCFVGAYLILGGRLDLVAYLGLIVIASKVLAPAITWMQYIVTARMHYVSATRIDEIMQLPDMQGNSLIEQVGDIELKRVSFSYDDKERPVLRNINLTMKKNQLTAIVGPSGSGKTTLLRLIARFWDVSEGAIYCGGKELIHLDVEAWLKNISMVLQNSYLFHETIRENILFGRKDATEAEMIEASERAQCHEFITELPEGYDTLIGEGGSTLSGGECQRIAIARALLKDTPILLLDEPTAMLDARNEVRIQQALAELVKGRTVIMIAHRLKTIQKADQIIVLEDGALAEKGDHQSLMAMNGLYARLWNMQCQSTEWKL